MSRSPFAESSRKQTSEDQVKRVEGTSYGSQELFCEHPFPVLTRQKARSYECQESLCEHPFPELTG
jgi:hypothetical protein